MSTVPFDDFLRQLISEASGVQYATVAGLCWTESEFDSGDYLLDMLPEGRNCCFMDAATNGTSWHDCDGSGWFWHRDTTGFNNPFLDSGLNFTGHPAGCESLVPLGSEHSTSLDNTLCQRYCFQQDFKRLFGVEIVNLSFAGRTGDGVVRLPVDDAVQPVTDAGIELRCLFDRLWDDSFSSTSQQSGHGIKVTLLALTVQQDVYFALTGRAEAVGVALARSSTID